MTDWIDPVRVIPHNKRPMDCTLALLADAANVSQEGKLNVLGAFANINTRAVPTVHPNMTLVLRFEASAAEAGESKRVQALLLDADGARQEGAGFEARFEVPPPQAGRRIRMHTIVNLVGTRFEREGDYQLAILINGDQKAEIPLSVTVIRPEEATPHDASN